MLSDIKFDNRILRSLSIDDVKRVYPRNVPNAIFSISRPHPIYNPQVVAISPPSLRLLGIDIEGPLSEEQRAQLELYFSGNKVLKGSSPHAHCYCGYQFGIFAGQLGDGAAISLGEAVSKLTLKDPAGNPENDIQLLMRQELQIKGGGITPYSRK